MPLSNCCPIEEAFIRHNGPMPWTAYRSSQQFCGISQQAVIGWNPNRVLRSTFFQRFVDVRLGKGRISSEPDFLAQLLQPLDLRQQELLPAVGAVNVAWPQLCGNAVSPAVEQEKRVIGGVCCRRSAPALRRPKYRSSPCRVLPGMSAHVLRPLKFVHGS